MAHDLRQTRELVSRLQKEDRELWNQQTEGADVEQKPATGAPEWLELDASAEIDARCEAIGKGLQGRSAEEIEEDAKDRQTRDDDEASRPLREAVSCCIFGRKKFEPSSLFASLLPLPQLCKHLDLHLDLLRQVYHCDYYSSIICDFPEELVRRSPKHLRKTHAISTQVEKGWSEALDSKHWLLVAQNKSNLESYGGYDLPELVCLMHACMYARSG